MKCQDKQLPKVVNALLTINPIPSKLGRQEVTALLKYHNIKMAITRSVARVYHLITIKCTIGRASPKASWVNSG